MVNLNSPEDLTQEIIRLAHELETDSEKLAQAELMEDKEAVALLTGEEKISVAQAEKQALVRCENKYHELKYKRDAKVELINAYKKRVEVLSWEMKTS